MSFSALEFIPSTNIIGNRKPNALPTDENVIPTFVATTLSSFGNQLAETVADMLVINGPTIYVKVWPIIKKTKLVLRKERNTLPMN